MGCNFDFTIQILILGVWIDVAFLGTKTATGGAELVSACTETLKKGIKGDYGSQFPTTRTKLSTGIIVRKILKKFIPDVKILTKKKKKRPLEDVEANPTKKVKMEKKEEADEEDELSPFDEKRIIFYSKEQFATFLQQLMGICDDVPDFDSVMIRNSPGGEDLRANKHRLFDLLRPIPMWCDLSLSAAGTTLDKWLDDEPEEIDDVTTALRANQQILLEKCKDTMLKHAVPMEKVNELTVADLKADDVRIAISDCENNIVPIKAGDTRNSMVNPEALAYMNMMMKMMAGRR